MVDQAASRRMLWATLAIAIVLSQPLRAAADPQEIEALVARFATAFLAADTSTLDSMLSPQYVHTNGGSAPLKRQEWLAYVSARRSELEAGQLSISRYENQDLQVTLQGSTAVVTGVNLSEGRHKGTPFTRKLRFTQVWVHTQSGWQRIAFHDADAAP